MIPSPIQVESMVQVNVPKDKFVLLSKEDAEFAALIAENYYNMNKDIIDQSKTTGEFLSLIARLNETV